MRVFVAFSARLPVALCVGFVGLIGATAEADAKKRERPNWGGFYFGANAGYLRNDDDARVRADASLTDIVLDRIFAAGDTPERETRKVPHDAGGFVGGGQLGYNWRLPPGVVAGLEADIQYSSLDGSGSVAGEVIPALAFFAVNAEQELEWFGTVRGRLGLAGKHLMVFGTGGLAYGRTSATASLTTDPGFAGVQQNADVLRCVLATGECLAGSESKTSIGWTAGGGFEVALGHGTTLKAEYLRVDLGDQTIPLVPQAASVGDVAMSAEVDNAYDIVRGGINFQY